jgi:protein-S-isoprenylcysteine O-methyltransferase Ste14
MAGIAGAWLLPDEWPESVRTPLKIVGVVLVVLGLTVALWARGALGRAFTALTRPPAGAERTESGPYQLVRHPMYGGGILLFVGLSLMFGVGALLLTAALAFLWRAKSAVEERELMHRFPEYDGYRTRTPHRFFPWIY